MSKQSICAFTAAVICSMVLCSCRFEPAEENRVESTNEGSVAVSVNGKNVSETQSAEMSSPISEIEQPAEENSRSESSFVSSKNISDVDITSESNNSSQVSVLVSEPNELSEASQNTQNFSDGYSVEAMYQGSTLNLTDEDQRQLFQRAREVITNNDFLLDMSVPESRYREWGNNGMLIDIIMDQPMSMTVSSETQEVSELTIVINDDAAMVLCNSWAYDLPGDYRSVFEDYIASVIADG